MATTGNTSTTNTTGLNAEKIGAMQQALSDYIKAVNSTVYINATRAQIQKAIKGTASESSLMKVNQAIDNQLAALTNQLTKFNDIFGSLESTYNVNDLDNGFNRVVNTPVLPNDGSEPTE